MRAKEFVSEAQSKKLTKRQLQSTAGVNIFNDRGTKWSSDYSGYRAMMAAAMTDGEIDPDIDEESYVGKSKTAYPYTQADQNKLKKAFGAVGIAYNDPTHGDLRSLELDDTNKTSPVAKPKKNKYGV